MVAASVSGGVAGGAGFVPQLLQRLKCVSTDDLDRILLLVREGEDMVQDLQQRSAIYTAAVNMHKCLGKHRDCELCVKHMQALCVLNPTQAREFHNQQRAFGLGRKAARMYKARAIMEERLGDTAKAIKMLQEGIRMGAHPEDLLQQCLRPLEQSLKAKEAAAWKFPREPHFVSHACEPINAELSGALSDKPNVANYEGAFTMSSLQLLPEPQPPPAPPPEVSDADSVLIPIQLFRDSVDDADQEMRRQQQHQLQQHQLQHQLQQQLQQQLQPQQHEQRIHRSEDDRHAVRAQSAAEKLLVRMERSSLFAALFGEWKRVTEITRCQRSAALFDSMAYHVRAAQRCRDAVQLCCDRRHAADDVACTFLLWKCEVVQSAVRRAFESWPAGEVAPTGESAATEPDVADTGPPAWCNPMVGATTESATQGSEIVCCNHRSDEPGVVCQELIQRRPRLWLAHCRAQHRALRDAMGSSQDMASAREGSSEVRPTEAARQPLAELNELDVITSPILRWAAPKENAKPTPSARRAVHLSDGPENAHTSGTSGAFIGNPRIPCDVTVTHRAGSRSIGRSKPRPTCTHGADGNSSGPGRGAAKNRAGGAAAACQQQSRCVGDVLR